MAKLHEIHIPISSIASIRQERRTWNNKYFIAEKGELVLKSDTDTLLTLQLSEPLHIKGEEIRTVFFSADDPHACSDRIRSAVQA